MNSTPSSEDMLATHPDEIFVWVRGYEGLYKISNFGRLISFSRGAAVEKKSNMLRGYKRYFLYKENTSEQIYAHRLVALHFVDGHRPGLVVNHKDFVKTNNHASNLEWVTTEENNKHAWEHDRCAAAAKSIEKKIIATSITTGEEIHFDSGSAASKHGFSRYAISKCVRGVQKMHRGYFWRLKDTAALMALKEAR
jgi:hypothetical protein